MTSAVPVVLSSSVEAVVRPGIDVPFVRHLGVGELLVVRRPCPREARVELAVVHEDGIGLGRHGGIDEREAGGDAAHQVPHLGAPGALAGGRDLRGARAWAGSVGAPPPVPPLPLHRL
mgnify:CR=1 FL=1